MATIKPASQSLMENTTYYLVRRAQARIAAYRNFGDGDLAMFLERKSFDTMAERMAAHFFHKSADLAIYDQVKELFKVAMIMAPILQRIPYSSKVDWHRGHVMSWFRCNISIRRMRFHLSIKDTSRVYDPERLSARLEALGIRDALMVEVLKDIYRRHAGGTTLRDILAHQIFDPILFTNDNDDFQLRHGAHVFQMDKARSDASIDLRVKSATVLDYRIKTVKKDERYHLDIKISDACLKEFQDDIKYILKLTSTPTEKVERIENKIRNLVERTRSARSALPQIERLKLWLSAKLKPLSANTAEAAVLPNVLVNWWLGRVDSKLYVKSPNMFFDPSQYDEKTFVTFFSPFREV
jgi:hypothetical protein